MQEQIDAVQRMQDYIGSHLTEEITLADLAGVSLFSPWYSYRLFTRQTGTTPADYIRRMRLSKSALKLRLPMWRSKWALAAWTDIRGHFCGSLAAIPGTMQQIRFLYIFLHPTALNSDILKGEQAWKI